MRRVSAERAALAMAAALLFVAVALTALGSSARPGQRQVLYALDSSGMQGPMYIPEVNGGFPRPWDEPSGHPSLSSVQYMPQNSTAWYPDQPEEEGDEADEGEGEGEGDEGDEGEGEEGAVEVEGEEDGADGEEEGADEGGEGANEAGDEGEGEAGAVEADGDEGSQEVAAEADDQGAGEEGGAEGEEAAAPEGSEEPATEKAGVQMLARVGVRSIPDPAEWLRKGVKAGLKRTVTNLLGASGAAAAADQHRQIPDPVEWMEQRYLKHRGGTTHLARKLGGTARNKMQAPTAQLFQMRTNPSYGGFKLASRGSADLARKQAALLGCAGTHYRRFGATETYTIAPCKTDDEEFKGLATKHFARHADVGTSVDGAFTDYKAIQFRHQWNHQDLADSSDDDFLQSSQSVAGAAINPFGNKASLADDAVLQSSAQALEQHAHPDAMAGMTSARHGPSLVSW